ncbi:hypothetical protein E2562_035805 [Oryza meyeriana var. granulata]|uniref:Uncharacterized protein n=1 Tax=Oryza meyeriana var. granulata TaxID=110450 RepID=A0A6G1DB60_9ORYZ|nr:hypothetical protein E2562_035805 [Oryza meyeriana var. granulata]
MATSAAAAHTLLHLTAPRKPSAGAAPAPTSLRLPGHRLTRLAASCSSSSGNNNAADLTAFPNPNGILVAPPAAAATSSSSSPIDVDVATEADLRENGFRSTRRTKLVCTVGPATCSAEELEALAVGGMNVARVNMCHGDREWHRGVIRAVRRLNEEKGFAVAVMMDTEGSEIHMGDLGGAPAAKAEIVDEDDEVHTSFWIPPPTNPLLDPDPPYPEWILLHGKAYLDHLTNTTTAVASTRDRHRIHVTFWSAAPSPSYFTVHCPGLERDKFAHMPQIIATDGSLVLLRIAICPRSFCEGSSMSTSSTTPPSLTPLPNPSSCDYVFPDRRVCLMRRGDGGFFVAALNKTMPCQRMPRKHLLHLYDSSTGKWDTKIMDVDSPEAFTFTFRITSKVINIGGRIGSVGWVDLWKGILICDMFLGNNVLRYIPLPSPPPWVNRGLL